MTVGAALALLGAALLLWPVPSTAQRRLVRLHRAARIAGTGVVAPPAWWSGSAGSGGAAGAAGSVGSVGSPAAAAGRDRRVVAVLVAVAAGLAGLRGGPLLGVAAGAAGSAVAVVVLAARTARRETAQRRALLTALAVLGGELDAGTALPEALAVARARAGPAAPAFDLAPEPGDRQTFGTRAGPGTDTDALAHARARAGARGRTRTRARTRPTGSADAAAVGHARHCLRAGVGLVAATGAPWSAVAAGIARDVAAHDEREREVGAALAGARASTVVVAGLPLLGLLLAAGLGADPLGFLLGTPAGHALLAAGAVLDLLGVLASTALARRAVR